MINADLKQGFFALIFVAACVLALACFDLSRKNDKLQGEILKLNAKSAICESDNAALKTAIDAQNTKISELQASAPRVEIVEKEVAKVERVEVPVKDANCERKLRFYEDLFKGLK